MCMTQRVNKSHGHDLNSHTVLSVGQGYEFHELPTCGEPRTSLIQKVLALSRCMHRLLSYHVQYVAACIEQSCSVDQQGTTCLHVHITISAFFPQSHYELAVIDQQCTPNTCIYVPHLGTDGTAR